LIGSNRVWAADIERRDPDFFPRLARQQSPSISGSGAPTAALSELNVIEQVTHVCQTTIEADAWERGQCLGVHGTGRRAGAANP
jgi:carbonic anhydrase